MDCREELDFHDDNSRFVDKAKESILLMKKKMFLSNDLIIQYNNKMKDFDELNKALCATRDEATKLKRENNANHTKVAKLESQILDYKKIQQDLENKISDQNVRIASDKCHLEQLVCKLEALEDTHSGMLIETGIKKSSLEGKIKELEQELRKLKKLQPSEGQLPERGTKRARKALAKNQIIERETVDIGVNTTEQRVPVITIKSDTADKSIITDEFYHTRDNPYPIFCENCESLTKPSIEKFCKIMTSHPPMLTEMSSSPRESSINAIANNLDPLVESTANNTLNPEIENLKQKIASLERKMKKRNRQASRESQHTGANCCGHTVPTNCCTSHATNHSSVVPPNVPINVQTDLMTEFWNRIMTFTNESSMKRNDAQRKPKKIVKKKSISLNKRINKASMKKKRKKCVSSTNWEIESDDCPSDNEQMNNSVEKNSSLSHILRLKPSQSLNERSSRRSRSYDSVEKFSEKAETRRNDKILRLGEKTKTNSRNSRVREKNNALFNDDEEYDEEEQQITKKQIGENNSSKVSSRRSSSRIHEKILRTRVNVEKTSFSRKSNVSISPINNSRSSITKSNSLTSEMNPTDTESAYYSQNSAINESTEISQRFPANLSNDDFSDAPMEHYSEEENRENTRKRKRANSPKITKPPVRSKLLGKLRALKKNTTRIFTKPSIQSSIEERSSASVSLMKKVTNESETVCNEVLTRKEEPVIEIAAKRQRIAHIPKKSLIGEHDLFQETRDVVADERDFSITENSSKDTEQRSENDEKLAEYCSDVRTQESSICHLPLDESMENTSATEDATNSLTVTNSSLTKKVDNEPIETSINSSPIEDLSINDTKISRNIEINSEECLKSLENPSEAEHDLRKIDDDIEKSKNEVAENLLKVCSNETFEIVNDNRAEMEKTQDLPETLESPTNIVESVKTTINNESPIENCSSNSYCTSKLPGSLHILATANILVPPISSRIERHPVTISTVKHNGDEDEKIRNSLEHNRDTINSTIRESLTMPLEKIVKTGVSQANMTLTTNEENLHSSFDQTSETIEKSSTSPDVSSISHLSISSLDQTTLSTKNSNDEHSSLHENVFPQASTSFDNNFASQTNVGQRNLINYDTSMLEDYHDNVEVQDSASIIANKEFSRKEKKKNSTKIQNIVRDLRTRQVLCKPVTTFASQQNYETIVSSTKEDIGITSCPIDAAAYQRGIRCLGTLLTRHLNEVKKQNGRKGKKLRKQAAVKLQIETEKIVRTELVKLVESEEWTSSIHANVISRLCQVSSRRTVSKSIVDFLIERSDIGEPLDRTYTPPAPVMTRTQQRIVALINGLERYPSMSGVSELVRAGIEFSLFRLGYSIPFEAIEPLARMVTVIARMKKDRESVRILFCNALYFLGRKACTVIHVALSVWPEVFPSHGPNLGELVNCMVHLIRTEQSAKASSVQRLLKDYYMYPESHPQSSVWMQGYMNALTKKYTGELELSILLMAKREGTEWAYKHIINGGLLQIIEDNNYPSPLNAISLLGFILKIFPIEDEDKTVVSMVERLCEMLNSSQGSPDREEGIVSALLSISRHSSNFSKIADSVLKWKPSKPMNYTTIEQINSFFKVRPLEWWNARKQDKLKNNLDV